ncbi:MAG: aspartate--tRNA ligase [Peptococcaceae bacterium]|nr:aspartate--tRNA ligase [Peptococcaceae bacterium]
MAEGMGDWKRSHMCGVLRSEHIGQKVVLMGWVQRRRDHGGLIFIDLRDREGLVQLVFSQDIDVESFNKAEVIRSEYVLAITGKVISRPEGTENPSLPTGMVDVEVEEVKILNKAKTPPFYIEDGVEVDENVRLRYRYLDLRRPEMYNSMLLRHRAAKAARDFLDRNGFLEMETPMLTRSTPEGARDYLVPSRLNSGKFFALPQSPQLFKQILMVAGMDKYFQIVRCFRDEDLRADRQPEFTQIDLEMSFVDVEDVLILMEEMIQLICKETIGVVPKLPFPRISYQEAMDRFGLDKPDTRFGLEIKDISDVAKSCGFKVFNGAIENGGQVRAINAKGCGAYSRKDIDDLTAYANIYGAKGLAYFIVGPEGSIKTPITKFFTQEDLNIIVERLQGEEGDLLLFVADNSDIVAAALGNLRLHVAEKMAIIPEDKFNFVWVLDFPLLEYDQEEKRYTAKHHPFTSPREEDLDLLDSDPAAVRARAYDLVVNGMEIGGGSIRIHQRNIQEKMFNALGLSKEEADEKFGFLMEAFEYGTPPHGGIAFGLDRLVMLLAGKKSIRDVIPFPKTASATCLLTNAPDIVDDAQLKELHIKTDVKLKGTEK